MKAQEELTKLFLDFDELQAFVRAGSLHLDDIMLLVLVGQSKQGSENTATALARALHVARPRLSRSLARLARAGLVQETVQKSDHRVSRYRLSNHGENVFFEIRRQFGAEQISQLLVRYCNLQKITREAEALAAMQKLSDSAQRILLLLLASSAPLPLTELARACHLAQSRASQAVSMLAEKGILAVQTGKIDARMRLVSLSSLGKKISAPFSRYIKTEI